ncbi:MAG: 4Fe-4S binding protein [Candidatus Marinimicrobia bacterium]|nr:4Fe-4S binding protein [Candidatus Neomarinimicrobiota bacterium]
MESLIYIFINTVETCLRMAPFPAKTGLIRIGNPDRNSPVLLTCNYHLTVQRMKRALRGLDAFLLVANSRGINVWCAATGGLFTNHDAVSVLKTSGIEDLVDHREVILPQLAATGLERKVIKKKTGWKGIWGPVEAMDIKEFLANGETKIESMRQVEFPMVRRFEMAVAWAFLISIFFTAILSAFWKGAIIPVVMLTWGVALLVFLAFPLYEQWLNPKTERVGFVLFDFGRGGFQLILLAVVLVVLVGLSMGPESFDWGFFLRWGIVCSIVILLVSIDLMGSTPVYKSGLHKDRMFTIELDEKRCRGAAFCEQVCPRNCYEVDQEKHLATRPRADLCVQCGACIVQCPFDSLFFKSPKGEIILPESIRKFKLNMMGKRTMNTVDR